MTPAQGFRHTRVPQHHTRRPAKEAPRRTATTDFVGSSKYPKLPRCEASGAAWRLQAGIACNESGSLSVAPAQEFRHAMSATAPHRISRRRRPQPPPTATSSRGSWANHANHPRRDNRFRWRQQIPRIPAPRASERHLSPPDGGMPATSRRASPWLQRKDSAHFTAFTGGVGPASPRASHSESPSRWPTPTGPASNHDLGNRRRVRDGACHADPSQSRAAPAVGTPSP